MKEIGRQGSISVSNHIHVIDCAMIGLATFPHRLYYTSIDGAFKMPLIRHIVKLLNALPMQNNIKSKRKLLTTIGSLLQNKKTIHFYPEAALWPYYDIIRNFKMRCI